MKHRFLKAICALCLVPAFLTGCWHEDTEEPDSGQLLISQELAEPVQEEVILPAAFTLPYLSGQSLDPVTCADGMQQVVGALLYEGLFQLDTQLEPQPLLCSGYTYAPETYTYVFSLRSGVTFTDGSPLTAGDVVQTLRRAMSSVRYGARLKNVASITAGDGTVTVVLTGPNTGFAALLDIPIVKAGTESEPFPTGTGPYAYSGEGSPHLTANRSWWQSGSQPLETICLSAAGDRDTMLYQFTSHDIQLITADLTGTVPISVTGSTSFQDADTTIMQYVGINTQKSPFNSGALRSALNLGINRTAVVGAYLSGHGAAAQFPVSPVSPLYPSELEETYSYDAFAGAMAEAGFASGSTRTAPLLVNSENSFKVSAAEQIAQALSAFDLKVEVQALPWEEYSAALAAGSFDLYYAEVKLTADWDLTPLLATGGTLNYGGWSNAQTDHLLAAYAGASDRSAALKALCAHLRQQSPILPVCFKSTSVLVQTDVVEGLNPTMTNPFYDFTSCTVHLREE